MVDTAIAVPAMDKYEKKRAYAQRERERLAKRDRQREDKSHNANRPKYQEYDFVMWDGEAPKDTGYSLFGSSSGYEICNPELTTEQCLDLLLEASEDNPFTINVIFGGRYDFDEILRLSIPWNRLARIKRSNVLHWHGYRIHEVDGKFLKVSKEGRSVTLWDCSGWFKCAYTKALKDYKVGPWEQISKSIVQAVTEVSDCGLTLAQKITHLASLLHNWNENAQTTMAKNGNSGIPCEEALYLLKNVLTEPEVMELFKHNRSDFLWDELPLIQHYMHLELKYGPPLMERIREICIQAGFNPHCWYGPSALAREALRTNHIDRYIGHIPHYVKRASQFAFAGGRFELVRGGILENLCSADENSAYMAAALELPDLSNGEWRGGRDYEPGKFAVYHIRYRRKFEDTYGPVSINPLFCRYTTGNVDWPRKVDGWYWAPEAELVKDDPAAEFVEAYVFDESSETRPFTFVREWYRKRLLLQNLPASNPSRKAEKAFKWALASIYGQLARTVGWDRKNKRGPRFHCLEWAGYITSRCRAEMYKVAVACGDELVSIDTDSVTARTPIRVPESNRLGDWKVENYDSGVFFQAGVFALKRDNEWVEHKARGIEERRGRLPVSPEMMISAIYDLTPIRLPSKPRYVTIRMALQHRFKDAGKWMSPPKNELVFGGGGKRYHRKNTCFPRKHNKECCESKESHLFMQRPQFTRKEYVWRSRELIKSQPYYIPWLDKGESPYPDANLVIDTLFYCPENADPEDIEWQSELIA